MNMKLGEYVNVKVRTFMWAELDFVEQYLRAMKKRGVNRVELAERLGVKPSYVTRLLSGRANLTIKTMARMCAAVQCEFSTTVFPIPLLRFKK